MDDAPRHIATSQCGLQQPPSFSLLPPPHTCLPPQLSPRTDLVAQMEEQHAHRVNAALNGDGVEHRRHTAVRDASSVGVLVSVSLAAARDRRQHQLLPQRPVHHPLPRQPLLLLHCQLASPVRKVVLAPGFAPTTRTTSPTEIPGVISRIKTTRQGLLWISVL